MTAANFETALAFVWRPSFDSPLQGFHLERGDPGGATKGGIIDATWRDAVTAGLVSGTLADASNAQLSTILRAKYWGQLCDQLPDGIDLLVFNGRMLTGKYPWLVQQCLGFTGDDVDGWLGPESLKVIRARDFETLINAISGVHYAYLRALPTWAQFGKGWAVRLTAAQITACTMLAAAPVA